MFNAGHSLALCRTVASQHVGDEHTRRVAQAFQQFAEEPLGGFGIAPALHQDVEDVPILIDCPPQIMNLAADADEHLVSMTLVHRDWRVRNVPRVYSAQATRTELGLATRII